MIGILLLTFGLVILALGVLLGTRKPSSASSPGETRVTWRLVIPRDPQFPIASARAWFAALAPLLNASGPHPCVEFRGMGREVEVRLSLPASWETSVRGQLAAWFPGARLEPVAEDEERERPMDAAWFLPLRLEKPDLYVLRTECGAADPLLGLFGLLTQDDLTAGIRLTWSPEPPGWRDWAEAGVEALRAGNQPPPRDWRFTLHQGVRRWRRWTGTAGVEVNGKGDSRPETLGAEAKLRESCFAAALSVWGADPGERGKQRCRALAACLAVGFRDPFGNTLVPDGEPTWGRAQAGVAEAPVTLSLSELAALFHLPAEAHPLFPGELSRQVAPSPHLTRTQTEQEPSTCLGEALTPEGPVPFGLSVPDRRFHTYVVGKTGTGKSTLLAHLLRQDLEAGHGCGLIDPHGDLAELVLSLVPPERYDEVIYFNPADVEYPIAFNLLQASTPEQRPLVASGVVGVFKKLYGDSWGPRLEHFLRNSVLALLESPEPSLLALPRLLTDKEFRDGVLRHVRDPILRSFFLEEFARYDPRWRMEAIAPILNKVGQFLASPVVRNIVGQSRSAFDLREVMDGRGIFIANLASGKIGEDNTALLGGLLVAGFQLAAMSRADLPESERQDFFLCVDEFQHFANEAFAVILSEARKYRLSLTLSHQYLDQLPPAIYEAVFGNVGTVCCFRVGALDTLRLGREFAPAFDGQDLINLPNYRFGVRLRQDQSFSARTLAIERGSGGEAEELSRRSHTRQRARVELEISDRWKGWV